MNYRKSLLTALLAPLIALGAATGAQAAGYAVFTHGASALGQGNAVTAHSDNPSTIFYNPALINKLEGTQFQFGTTAIFSSREFESSATGARTSNDSVFFPSTFYATHKFNDSLSAGLGVFNPFGLGTEWDEEWEGRFLATKSELTTFNINPVLSYRVIPSLAIAAGLDVILLDATLEKRVPAGAFGLAGPATETGVQFKGDGTGVGFNVGVAWDACKTVTIGASYRSEVKVDIDGTSRTSPTFTVPFFNVTPLDSKGETSVKLPQQITAGISYQVTAPLIIEAGVRWEDWSAFKELQITLDNGTPLAATRRDWHDTYGLNVGGKYRVNDTVALLAGYVYGNDAVPNSTFDPSIPDSNTHVFCVGTDLNFEGINAAFSYAYQRYENRTKNNSVDPLLPPNYADGVYKNDAHLLALSLGYKF
ncbi:MAG: transporter [Geobacteraceae bacterium GWC2_58_44]|nr:MAG: transporter [Geobacteraceae bacterium GWC2_58_44]HBG06865.1 transporter [Geobacter sp.]